MRLSETVSIAADAGIRHPWDHRSGFPYVMTTDFLITTKEGIIARTVKSVKELENKRVREKFEIERRYWADCGIEWKIVTENQIDVTKAKNIIWLRSGMPESSCIADAEQRGECRRLFMEMYRDPEVPFTLILETADRFSDTGPGIGMSVFRALMRERQIDIDLSKPICYADPRRQ